MAVQRADIVAAGLHILDAHGLADVTMRRVADALNVQAGALYWHLPNKQALLAAMTDSILTAAAPPVAEHWRDWLVQWSQELRRVILAHRDAAELVSSSLATGLVRVDVVAPAAQRLVLAGCEPATAQVASQALMHLMLGLLTLEQARRQLSELGVDITPAGPDQATFERSVDLLLDGVAPAVP